MCEEPRKVFQTNSQILFIPEYDGYEEEDLRNAHQQGLRMLRLHMRRLEKAMRDDVPKCPHCEKKTTMAHVGLNKEVSAEIVKCAKALKDISQEKRAHDKEEKSRADNMSIDERIGTVVHWYSKLPSEKQDFLFESIFRVRNGKASSKN
jgi:Zn ribbon nucleic-acid-binding protein